MGAFGEGGGSTTVHADVGTTAHEGHVAAHRIGTWAQCGETKVLVERCFHTVFKTKIVENSITKEEDKEAKVEAKKESLPEKLQPTSKKDQVIYKLLI